MLFRSAEGSGLAQTIRVAVDSRLGFVGGQFDVVLPKGVKLVSVASSSHDALMGEVDGAFRVLVSNLENTEIVNGQAFVEESGPVLDAFRQLGRTLRDARKEKHIFLYLLAFFFFIDGVYTIIDMATAYGAALGLDTTGLLLALLLTQFVAFPCSILFGRLSSRYDAGLLIKVSIVAYILIVCFGVFLMYQWQFWVLAVLVGMFQGGIQALSRSYMGKIIPADRSGEYFGLMDICGKGASFVGTMLISVVSQLTAGTQVEIFGMKLQNENIAISSLILLLGVGYVLFCKADKLNKERTAV